MAAVGDTLDRSRTVDTPNRSSTREGAGGALPFCSYTWRQASSRNSCMTFFGQRIATWRFSSGQLTSMSGLPILNSPIPLSSSTSAD